LWNPETILSPTRGSAPIDDQMLDSVKVVVYHIVYL
jgi:hypothetical protein